MAQKKRRFGFLSDVGDFANAVVDRVGGGIVRDAIRAGAFLSEPLPGEQRRAAEGFIKRYSEVNNPENETGIGNYDASSTGGKVGRVVGTGIKVAEDVYGLSKGFKAGEEIAGNVNKGSKLLKYAGGTIGGLTANDLQEIGRGGEAKSTVARIPVQLAESVGQPFGLSSGEINPNSILGAVTGKSPIKSYQKQGEELAQTGEDIGIVKGDKQKKVLGLGLAPLLIAGDLAGGGGEEKALVKGLVRESTEAGIKKLLSSKFDKQLVKAIAPDLAKATDKKTVRKILENATEAANKSGMSPGAERAVQRVQAGIKETQDPLSQLKQEALKYKSADEFVKAQGEPLYHGTDATFDNFSTKRFGQNDEGFLGRGVYLSSEKDIAKDYGANMIQAHAKLNNPIVIDDPYAFGGVHPDLIKNRLGLNKNASPEAISKALADKGHDGVVINKVFDNGDKINGIETLVVDPTKIHTKQQLNDLYNQAHAEAKGITQSAEAPKSFSFLKAEPNQGEGYLGDAALKSSGVVPRTEPVPVPETPTGPSLVRANPNSGEAYLGDAALKAGGIIPREGPPVEAAIGAPSRIPVANPNQGEGFLGNVAIRPNVEGQAPAAAPSAADQIMSALRGKKAALGVTPEAGAKSIRARQEELYSAERSRRLAMAATNAKDLTGSARYYAELKAQKGALPKLEYTGLSAQLDDAEKENLLTGLQGIMDEKGITPGSFTSLNIQTALRKILNGGNGVPTEGEIRLLEETFGNGLAKEIRDDVDLHKASLGIGKRAYNLAGQILGTPRAIMASADFSGGLRQGLAAATRHPIIFAKNFSKQFRYAFDNDAYEAMIQEVREHPNYDLMRRGKLAITDATHGTGVGEREEQYISSLAEKIPGIGRVVKGSDRAYSGLLTKMRVDIFNQLVDNAQRAGHDFSTVEGDRLLKQLGEVVNTSTGRGSLGKLEHSAQGLSTALFAPRLIASRLQMLNPQYYIKLQGPARREALTTLMSLAAVTGGILWAAKQAGADVNTDPTNADFGKIKVGDTRLDILGGHQQYIRLGAELISGKITSSITGSTIDIDEDTGNPTTPTRLDIINRFLQNKESPILSFASSLLEKKDATGKPLDFENKNPLNNPVGQRFIPLVAQDIADLFTHDKGVNPAIAGPLSVFGVGLQTYGSQDLPLSKQQNTVLERVKETGTPEHVKAYTSYFQTARLVSGKRTKASDDINAAIEQGDYNKAVKIAQDYNEKVTDTFQPWIKKYQDVATNELRKDYSGLKIKLDKASIKQRRLNQLKKQKAGIIPR